jgi:hypothetical protein
VILSVPGGAKLPLAKLHLAHRTQAVIHALKQGLISLDEIEL